MNPETRTKNMQDWQESHPSPRDLFGRAEIYHRWLRAKENESLHQKGDNK